MSQETVKSMSQRNPHFLFHSANDPLPHDACPKSRQQNRKRQHAEADLRCEKHCEPIKWANLGRSRTQRYAVGVEMAVNGGTVTID
jgi:hypothetical protein